MDFELYQKRSRETAVYPDKDKNPLYPALGLAGETGEVSEHIKKSLRDDAGVLTETRKQALAKELGDVLWYVAQLATECGLSLTAIAEANLEKLASRKARGQLHGSGDDR